MIIFEKYISTIWMIVVVTICVLILGYFIVWCGFLMKDLRSALTAKEVFKSATFHFEGRALTNEEVKAITAWYNTENTKMFSASINKKVKEGTLMFGFDVRVPNYIVEDIKKYKDYTVNFKEKQ